MAYDAVQLFVDRARQANPDFALSPDTAQAVVDICRLVEGLPLGIVLAAAWVRQFSPARITASIKANLDFLASSSPDAAPQHASLRAVFNHSWSLLSEVETQVFRKLSVFRGGWEEEAAQKVLGYERQRGAALRPLLSLVDKSLVRQDAPGRFNTHDLLRQYAAEKLNELPEEQYRTNYRHAQYYLELAEAAEVELRSESKISGWTGWNANTAICGRRWVGQGIARNWKLVYGWPGLCRSSGSLEATIAKGVRCWQRFCLYPWGLRTLTTR